jgi:hypothetical protein
MDADGDGRSDIVKTEPDTIRVWLAKSSGGYSNQFTAPTPEPSFVFSNPAIRLADMDGDRLLDFVEVSDGLVRYRPSISTAMAVPTW